MPSTDRMVWVGLASVTAVKFFFCRDWVSVSCFTGQLPGIGTVFILASLQMCKVQRQSPLASQGGGGGGDWSLRGQGGVVQGGH